MYYEKRVCVLYSVLLVVSYLLLARLYNLSKPEMNESMTVLDGQYTGRIDVAERNGFVYDRNGVLLSHNKTGYIALVNPKECKDAMEIAEILSKNALVSGVSDIYERILEGVPFTLVLSDDNLKGVKGVEVYDMYEESFDIAKHFMGYYNSDGEGVSGLRGEYSSLLTKQLCGAVYATFESDAKNKSMSGLTVESGGYVSRDGIITTLDKEIQLFCDTLGDETVSGAVVVSDVKSGEILAMSSFPDYDTSQMEKVLASDKGELVNRAASSFTPGSVFKIAVAAAALETDEELWDYTYTCLGEITVGEDTFRCHNRSGHGHMTMKDAFANSCNTYFISLGRLIGIKKISEIMKRLELDEPTAADFLCENNSFFIDENNKTSGYLANISFGQGDLCLSPLDMIRVVNAVSTGYITPLSVIKGEIRDGEKQSVPVAERKRIFSKNTCEKMCIMMKECTANGTGRRAAANVEDVGGKTATAQTGRFSEDGVEYVHKWFCGVYPAENPRISVCVLCDYSTENGVSPAVVFSEIIGFLAENGF